MGRPKKWRIQSAARARASKKVLGHPNETTGSSDTEIDWCLLCKAYYRASARLSGSEVSCGRGHWSCGSHMPDPAKVSLRTQFYWVLLGSCQTMAAGALWLHFLHPADEHATCFGFRQQTAYSEMAKPDAQMGWCIQEWIDFKGCPNACAGLQFKEIQIPSSSTRDCCCCFWLR